MCIKGCEKNDVGQTRGRQWYVAIVTRKEGRISSCDGLRQQFRKGPAGHGAGEPASEGGGVAVGLGGGVDRDGADGRQTATLRPHLLL